MASEPVVVEGGIGTPELPVAETVILVGRGVTVKDSETVVNSDSVARADVVVVKMRVLVVPLTTSVVVRVTLVGNKGVEDPDSEPGGDDEESNREVGLTVDPSPSS